MDNGDTDDKIERLVRSVLEAVDARLEAVRQEIQQLTADVHSRHTLVTNAIADLERRINRQASSDAPAAADHQRMEQATQMLLERIEAMHQRTTMATNERFAHLTREIDLLRGATLAPHGEPITADIAPALEPLTAPLLPDAPRLITSQVPVIEQHAPPVVAPAPAPSPAPAPAPTAVPAVPAASPVAESAIDLDRLSSLLSERLGNLHLDPLPGFDPTRIDP